MFRSRSRRALVVGTTGIAIIGLLLGLTGTALAADNRVVYFGDPATVNANPSGDRTLDLSPVTAGNVFTFDVLAQNLGNQSLTHSIIGLGSQVTARDWGTATPKPSLPPGSKVLVATWVNGANSGTCTITSPSKDGASCDVGTIVKGTDVIATFAVEVPTAGSSHVYASLRVAENNPDRGDNNNSFFADSDVTIGATNSDNNSTFKLTGQELKLSTKLPNGLSGDKMTTTVEVPDGFGGLISIVEKNGPTGCGNTPCIGQEVELNVRNGADVAPYVEWRLEIIGLGAGNNKGGIVHTLDNGQLVDIRFTKANTCSATLLDDCIVSYVVNKNAGTTVIVFRTDTNGRVKAG